MSNMRSNRAPTALLLVAALATLPGCATKNTVSDGDDNKLMLRGYDPVAYFTVGTPTLGSPQFKAEHDGVAYRFASAVNREAFLKEPEKYAPQFGGFCTNGMVYGIPWGGDPSAWKIIDGKLYIFGGQNSKNYFLMDEHRNMTLARTYWDREVKDMSSAFLQSTKRLVFRVPHYKSGEDLQAQWQARQTTLGK